MNETVTTTLIVLEVITLVLLALWLGLALITKRGNPQQIDQRIAEMVDTLHIDRGDRLEASFKGGDPRSQDAIRALALMAEVIANLTSTKTADKVSDLLQDIVTDDESGAKEG